MSFGRIRNKTLPTHFIEEEKTPAIELQEVMNLQNLTDRLKPVGGAIKNVGKGIANAGKGVVDFHVGGFKALEAGIQTGKAVFHTFWAEVFRDAIPEEAPAKPMSEFHFNMLKRGMTDKEKAYYRFLEATDEQLEGSYEDYVRAMTEEAQSARDSFKDSLRDNVISKKEQVAINDDRGQELIDEYGVSAMLGYGVGQMMGNYNEIATNVVATYMGVKFGAGTSIVGMDDVMNISENILSNTISESIIADAKGEEIDRGKVATRTVIGSIFMKGMGTVIKKFTGGVASRLEIRNLKRAEAVLAESMINERHMEDAVERGLTSNLEGGYKVEFPSEKSRIFTDEVGSQSYKEYVILKSTEDYAYSEDAIGEVTQVQQKQITEARKAVEQFIRDGLKKEYGDTYSFEKYMNDMDKAYTGAKFSELELERNMEIPTSKAITNEDIGSHIDEAKFLEDQDISVLTNLRTEHAEVKDLMGKTDADMRSWFDDNC